jgi:hypothetical protein
MAKAQKASQYAYYKFPSAVNMDVYMGEELIRIDSLAELQSLVHTGKRTVLFVGKTTIDKEPDFARWIENYPAVWDNGRYRYYLFNAVLPYKEQRE